MEIKMKEFDILICLNKNNEFVGAHIKKRGVRAKEHKRIDYKDRGTLFQHVSKNGTIIANTFLRPNDFWRFVKALVTKEQPKRKKKNATGN